MAEYKIRHETLYDYTEPVLLSHHLAHLLPRETLRQKWLSHNITVCPTSSVKEEHLDMFGNRVLSFSIEQNHVHFSVIAEGEVVVSPVERMQGPGPIWEDVAKRMENPETPEDFEALPYRFFSPLAVFDLSVKHYVELSFTPGRPLYEAVMDLVHRIFHEFRYAPCTTRVGTTVAEVLRERRGVCQDFAHLMVSGLRSFGIPSRYVSGYLLTYPAPGKIKKIGADATHAWVSVYIPPFGWVDVDPTNDLLVSDEHIILAWGRDFGDVSPLKGVIIGGGPHRVHVGVEVTAI
ncbi:MAG: transglutaminase family protein [Fibrobacteraceae bacterium]|nr:transglutaminase family protein [Fibrobacteraceae bacterium]